MLATPTSDCTRRESVSLKLGLQLGYWGAGPDPRVVGLAQEAEKLGFDAVFTAEAWGSDVFTRSLGLAHIPKGSA